MNNLRDDLKAQHLMSISLKIAPLRKKLGLTQQEFTKRAGVGLRFLRELEQGKMSVRLDKLIQVLDFLGCHLEIKGNNEQINTWVTKLGVINTSKTDLAPGDANNE